MEKSDGGAQRGNGRATGKKRKRAKGTGLVVAYDETARRCAAVLVPLCHRRRPCAS